MKTLSKIGGFTLLVGLILVIGVYWHYGGFTDSALAIGKMLAAFFYGGILWIGLFCILMALLFLSN